MTPRQLSFDLPPLVALGPDDYFVSGANAHAYTMVTTPDGWPENKLALVGPRGSGKSHLARVFQHVTGARLVSAQDIVPDMPLPDTALVVEDMDTLPRNGEETMFHIHNHLRARRLPLLLTADRPPVRWNIALPDLASRMQAAPAVEIGNPDDRLLQAILAKLFSDRQLMPPPVLITYLSARIERSFSAAVDIVARLDREALSTGQKVSVQMAGRLLDNSAA